MDSESTILPLDDPAICKVILSDLEAIKQCLKIIFLNNVSEAVSPRQTWFHRSAELTAEAFQLVKVLIFFYSP